VAHRTESLIERILFELALYFIPKPVLQLTVNLRQDAGSVGRL